jgi:hypothetical protein
MVVLGLYILGSKMVVLSLHILGSKMTGFGRARLWLNSHQGQKFLSARTVMQPPVECFRGPFPRVTQLQLETDY